jgi:hypothetical protein
MQHLILSTGWQLKERNPGRSLAEDFSADDMLRVRKKNNSPYAAPDEFLENKRCRPVSF